MRNKVYFVTTNDFKIEEAKSAFEGTQVDLAIVNLEIQEIMHLHLEVIIRDKLLKAYKEFGHPCVVEHGALHITALNQLPGGISKVVWDTVGDKICQFIPAGESRSATAKSVVGYCDGRKIHLFTGETSGVISEQARGNRKFQWDPIFIPEGSNNTYAEIGFPEKLKFSQAIKAWNQLIKFLKPGI